jgi:PAS domain S-box-containing protein
MLWVVGGWATMTLGGRYLPPAPVTVWLLTVLNSALFLISRHPSSTAVRVYAGVVAVGTAAVGTAVLGRLWIPWIPPFELAVTPGKPVVEGVAVGLVSPYTGAVFIATSGAMLMAASTRLRPVPRIIAAHFGIAVGIAALVSLAGQIVGGPLLAASSTKPMALSTAVVFLVTAVGLVAWAQPDLFAKVRLTAPATAPVTPGARAIRRSVTLLILLLIVTLAVTGLVLLRREIADLRESQKQLLEGIASLKAAEVSHWRQERLMDGDWLLHAQVARRIVGGLNNTKTAALARAEAREWLGPLVIEGEYDHASIYGLDGRVLFESPEEGAANCPVLLSAVSVVRPPGQLLLTELHQEPGYPDSAGLGLIVPVSAQRGSGDNTIGEPIAFLVLHADAKRRFYPAMMAWPGRSETGDIALVRRDGNAALVMNRLRHHAGAGFSLRMPLSSSERPAVRALKGGFGAEDGIDYRGVPVLAAGSPVAGSAWVVVAKIDRREVYALVRDRAWMVSVSLVLMTVGVALGLSLVHRRRDAVAFARETAERRRRQDAEQNFQTLFRQMLDAFALHEIICDDRGKPVNYRFLAANPAFELLTGLKAEQIIGRTVLDVLPGTESWWIDTYGQVALTGTPAHFEHFSAELGRHFAVTAFSPAHGQFVALFNDVTERLQTQALLIQAEKMRSVAGLAAGVAHEINNPLGIVAQATDNVERRVLGDLPANRAAAEDVGLDFARLKAYHERREIPAFIRDIREATARATRIVSNMLEFSRRSDAGKAPADLAALFDRALALAATDLDLRERCDLRAVTIVRDFPPDLPPVPLVALEIEQVLLNLIINAAQAMAELPAGTPPRLVLRAYLDEGVAVVQVIDNGPGMTPDVRRRAFEPFFTTKPAGWGTGLGLAVVFAIVAQHHKGRVDIDSSPGEGTRVTVRLPLHGDAETHHG